MATALYVPYGGSRYPNWTMPESYGFTGQRQDPLSGLDYFGAPLRRRFGGDLH